MPSSESFSFKRLSRVNSKGGSSLSGTPRASVPEQSGTSGRCYATRSSSFAALVRNSSLDLLSEASYNVETDFGDFPMLAREPSFVLYDLENDSQNDPLAQLTHRVTRSKSKELQQGDVLNQYFEDPILYARKLAKSLDPTQEGLSRHITGGAEGLPASTSLHPGGRGTVVQEGCGLVASGSSSSLRSFRASVNRAAQYFAATSRRRDRVRHPSAAPRRPNFNDQKRSVNSVEMERAELGYSMRQPARAVFSMTRPHLPNAWDACKLEREWAKGELHVGRSLFSNIIDDKSKLLQISSTHMVILCRVCSAREAGIPERGDEGRRVFVVRDTSENGTIVNGQKVGKGNEKILKDGDLVCLRGTREDIVSYSFAEIYDDSDEALAKQSTETLSRDASLVSTASDGLLQRHASKEFRRFLRDSCVELEVQDFNEAGEKVSSFSLSKEDASRFSRRLSLTMDIGAADLERQLSDASLRRDFSSMDSLHIRLGRENSIDVEIQGKDLISGLGVPHSLEKGRESSSLFTCPSTSDLADIVLDNAEGELLKEELGVQVSAEPETQILRIQSTESVEADREDDLGPVLSEVERKLSHRSLLRRKLVLRLTKGPEALATANLPPDRQVLKRKLQEKIASTSAAKSTAAAEREKLRMSLSKSKKIRR